MRHMSKAGLLGHTAAIALLLPALGHAQTASDGAAILLQPIIVDAQTGTGPVNGVANPATQAGSKSDTPITEIPQSVSVVGAEVIRAGNIGKLDEALGYVAGVQGAPFGHDSDTNWYYLRGFDATQTGIFQDGLPHYSYGFGGFYIDPFAVERIEVLKGPASVLYGGSSPGGLLNYVTKAPTGVEGGELEVGADENGRAWTSVDVNTATINGVAYRFTGKLERVDGYGAFDPGFHGYLAPSVKMSFGETDVTLSASYTNINEDHVGGSWLPYYGTVKAAPFGYIDRDFNTSDPEYDWYKRDQVLLSSLVEHDFGNGWSLSNTTRFGWSDIDESSPYGNGYVVGDPTSLNRVFFQHQTDTKTILNDTRVERTFLLGNVEHRLMFGMDLKWFEMDQVQGTTFWQQPTPPISVTDPQYGGQPFIPVTPYLDNTITSKQAGLYVQDQIRWGDGWIATLNGRFDASEVEADGSPAFKQSQNRASWRAGIAKEFANGMVPYASYATYFNPVLDTLSNGEVAKAETGDQVEVGLKWAPTGTNALFTVALFDITRQNVLQSDTLFLKQQFGEVTSRGIEFEGKGEIAEGLTLTAAATAMDVKVQEGNEADWVGKTPYPVVERLASLKLDYEVPSVAGLTVSGGIRYQGSSWADNANTLEVPSQTLLDAGASYDFGQGWNVNFAVSNLTDETYVSSCNGANTCYYGDGRKASVALRKSW